MLTSQYKSDESL